MTVYGVASGSVSTTEPLGSYLAIDKFVEQLDDSNHGELQKDSGTFYLSLSGMFFAEIGAESPTTEYAWQQVTLDASGAWEVADPAYSSTTESINAIEANARVLIPSGTIVRMFKIRESDGDDAYRFALLPIGTFASPKVLDDGVSGGGDDDAPAGDSWTRVGQTVGGDDGFTFPIHRVSYDHAGDQVLHGQYRTVTVDHFGNVSVGSVETEYTIDTPVDCPSDLDEGTY